jgi:hypothetical protein
MFIGYVDLSLVHFVEMDGYKSKNAPACIMSGLTQSWARDILRSSGNSKIYCFAVWSEIWEQTEKTKKEWLIFKSLYSISPALDGKIRNYDVQDYGFIVEYFVRSGFGPYWMDKDNLPSLLDNDIPLIVPMDDDD